MSRLTLLSKAPNEIATETFDFTSRLAASETISTATVTAAVYSGASSAAALAFNGSATISGQTVTQRVSGGTSGAIYLLTCAITTSTGQALDLSGFLPIVPLGA